MHGLTSLGMELRPKPQLFTEGLRNRELIFSFFIISVLSVVVDYVQQGFHPVDVCCGGGCLLLVVVGGWMGRI